jgi:hypothetical protein
MENEITDDIKDEVKFLTEQNIPISVISQTLGLSLDMVDRIRSEELGHFGLGRIRSART